MVPDPQTQETVAREDMHRVRPREKDAFEEMFFTYYPKLLVFVERYVQSQDIADDIVKDLFVDIWQRRESLAIHTSLKAYLYTAARNRTLNFLRSTKHQQHLTIRTIEDDDLMLIRSLPDSPLEVLEKKEIETAVQKGIEALPGRCRLVLTLHWHDGLRYSEIAQVLEISVKTVENHMARAFRLLHHSLSRFLAVLLYSASWCLEDFFEYCVIL